MLKGVKETLMTPKFLFLGDGEQGERERERKRVGKSKNSSLVPSNCGIPLKKKKKEFRA